ncbi:Hypothetical predicted protein, partial [Olea europaea subsp. europaea]
ILLLSSHLVLSLFFNVVGKDLGMHFPELYKEELDTIPDPACFSKLLHGNVLLGYVRYIDSHCGYFCRIQLLFFLC